MSVDKGVAIFFLVTCALNAVATLLFACIHFAHGWWCLFIIPPLAVAFLAPAVCLGYNELNDALLINVEMDRHAFENCRMLGWSIAGVLVLFTYCVPIIVWYNSTFSYAGVLIIDLSVNSVLWAFTLWLRVFIRTTTSS